MLRPILIAVAIVCLTASVALSDSEMAPYGHVTSSESGRHYFRMAPPRKDAPARGTLVRVRPDGKDEPLWSVEGWYAFRVFVARHGESVVRLGNWPRGMGPKAEHLAVAFYKDGKEVKRYSTKDLIQDVSKVRPSVSHYQFYDWNDPPALVSMHVDGSYQHVFRLRTIDGITYLFEPATGRIVNQSPSAKDVVSTKAAAIAIAHAVLDARFGMAPALEPGRTLEARRLRDEWHVDSTPKDKAGFHVRIQARDGRVLRLEQRP
ncbi:MAG: hypothetical protein QNJ98_17105 [Planctomycetota bacterium]|nr:hypothetical protein [Planctomycetota bacterium]